MMTPIHRRIACFGINYRTATVELRERLSFSPALLAAALSQFRRHLAAKGVEELVILSTCNRVELYTAVSPTEATDKQYELWLADFLATLHGVPAAHFASHTYHYVGEETAVHLCRVASGLDSMIVGEPQILGQVSNAFATAQQHKATGPVLSALFQSAIHAGKRTHSETNISRNPASVSSGAVHLAQKVVGDLAQSRVVVVGAGKMGQLTLKALRQRGVARIDIINRTYRRAVELAEQWDGTAYRFEQLVPLVSRADVVVCSTSAPQPIIDNALMQRVLQRRNGNALTLIDIAVPRDVAPEVGDMPGVHLFDVDGLQHQVEITLAERRREIPHVEAIIEEEMEALRAQLCQLNVRPVITDLRQKAEAIRQRELQRTLHYLGDVDAETMKHIQHLSRSLVNKLLHEPTVRLREQACNGRSAEYAQTVRHLFGLEETAENEVL